ncbi:RNA polymerase sigma factor [Roseomonas alkaliterrae]|uniref:RNA polymerase sigma-70 factor (ECF subfamily) n=1 Tax=Neoroseomonas alkaliterrae TaxID=1452450 RepID=A0A840XMH9_9PROT|nr:RNA polymerase sigma-70 factor (ECF subfamily) [Neoroseomonas alkaliterrae]MBR0678784.1 RNA polymerase sigma factor [Neoroseomonas alkaliterrae]
MPSSFQADLVALLPRLRRFARALAGDPDTADDLVQGACERALRAQDSFAPGTRFDSWMFRILRNLWLDSHRRRAARGGSHETLEAAESIPGAAGAEATIGRVALREAEAALLRLPEEQREALVLTCIEEFTYAEAAALLGLPPGTVMSRVARGRIALARMLRGDGEAEAP